ncbi:MAG: hypothetical protein AAFX52_01210 [Pseudomonadota bacterium]
MTETLDRWLEEPFDPKRLLPWEKTVKTAALEGEFAWLWPEALKGETAEDGPTIRARFLEALLLGVLGEVHHRGVRFVARTARDKPARVVGQVDLLGAGAAGQPLPLLLMVGWAFDQRPVFDMAHLTFLQMNNCKFAEGLDLQRAHIRGGLILNGIESKGMVNLNGAKVAGQLSLSGARLSNKGGLALNGYRATAPDGVFLQETHALGEIIFRSATIGGDLSLTGSKLCNHAGTALSLDGATIEGHVFGRAEQDKPGVAVCGRVSCHSAAVKGAFEWDGAVLLSGDAGGPALVANNLHLAGQAFFEEDEQGRPFAAFGGLSLQGARLMGPAHADHAVITAPHSIGRQADGWAKDYQHLAFTLDDGTAAGDIRCRKATILGALSVDGRTMEGDLTLDDTAPVATGSTARQDQDDIPWEEHADRTKEGVALSAVRSTIKGALQMRRFGQPDPAVLDRIEVEPLDPEFFGEEASKAFKAAFDDAIAKTKKCLEEAADHHHPQGHLFLQNAEIGSLQDDVDRSYPQEPGHTHLDGLTYHHLDVKVRDGMGQRRLAWLRHQYKDGQVTKDTYRPQPYDHLTGVLRQQGHHADANAVGAGKREDVRKAGLLKPWDRLVSQIYSLSSGSGYNTGQVTWVYLLSLFAAWLACVACFAVGGLEVADDKGGLGGSFVFFDLMAYTVDLYVPLIRFQTDTYFEVAKSPLGVLAGVTTFAIRIIGLILTGILALTYTGVTRKD